MAVAALQISQHLARQEREYGRYLLRFGQKGTERRPLTFGRYYELVDEYREAIRPPRRDRRQIAELERLLCL